MFGLIPLPVKIFAIIFIVAGAAGWGYMRGSTQAEIALANYKAEAEEQISSLKEENLRISDNVQVQYIDRTNTIREKEIVYRDAASTLGPGIQLSNGWVHLHDVAAKMVNPNASLAADQSPSGVMDNTALAVVLQNYSICKQNSEQLESLQQWIRDNRRAIERTNQEREE